MVTIILLLLVFSHLDVAICQGLRRNPDAARATGRTYQELQAIYKRLGGWSARFRQSRVSACRNHKGSLCASNLDQAEQDVLLLATSPKAYDSRGHSAVSRVQDQSGCYACVAFSIVGAAESAMASALQRDASSLDLSEQDFYFCKSSTPGFEPSCSNTWSLKEGLDTWIDLTKEGKYITTEKCLPFRPHSSSSSCSGGCREVDPALPAGSFVARSLGRVAEMQDYIRKHGSILCSMEISSDFRPFFKSNPKGVYKGPEPTALYEESHAVQVIGYNNKEEWWLTKNSWGTGFADGGFFKVGFHAASICGDSYVLKFVPENPPKPASQLSRSPSKPGCYEFKATDSDYISKVVYMFEDWGLTPQQLLLDNLNKIRETDMYLGGLTLTLCGIKPPPPPASPAKQKVGSKFYVRWCDNYPEGATCFRFKSAVSGKPEEACYDVKPDSILRENSEMRVDISFPVYWYQKVKGEEPELKQLHYCSYSDGQEARFGCPDGGMVWYLKWCSTKPGTMCFRFRDEITGKDRDACYPIKPDGKLHVNEGMTANTCYPVYWYSQAAKGQQPNLTPLKYVAYKDGYEAWFDCK